MVLKEQTQKYSLKNTTKIVIIFAFIAKTALASSEAGAYFLYEYGKMYEVEQKLQSMNLSTKMLFQNPLSFKWNSAGVESDGGRIALFSASFPFTINSCVLEPSILFGKGAWERGDFQYFYGKPDLPFVLGFGMSFYQGHNSFTLDYTLFDGKILNNKETAELFDLNFYIYNAFYKLDASKNINLYAGYAGLNGEATGALTAKNQGYFLFPYSFYKTGGLLNIKAVYGMANLKAESAVTEYGIDLGTLVIIREKNSGYLNYKYRKIFADYYGDEEVSRDFYSMSIKGSGVVFSVFSIQTKKIRLGENYIQYGVKKPLAIPFGKLFSTRNFENDEPNMSVKDILLLGLTTNVNVYF